jgi:hypothetical protein
MRRWLLDKNDPIVESDFPIEKDATLRCTRGGQVMENFKDKSAFDPNAEREKELANMCAKFQAEHSREDVLKDVRRLIGLRPSPKLIKPNDAGEVRREGYALRKLVFETEPGIKAPALHFLPPAETRKTGVVLYLNDKGMAELVGSGANPGEFQSADERGSPVCWRPTICRT